MQNLSPTKARRGRTAFNAALAAMMIFAAPAIVPQTASAQVQVMDVSALAERRGISVELLCAEELPRVNADQDRLLQVLINLLTNAVTFGPIGSVVSVRARRRRG